MDPTDISTLTPDSLLKANEEMFQPEHLTLIAAGNFDRQKLYEVVDEAFKDKTAIKPKPQPRAKSAKAKPQVIQPTQARISVVDDPSIPRALLRYGSGLGPRPYQEMTALLVTDQFMVGGQGGAINQSFAHDLFINSSVWGSEIWYDSAALSAWESRVDYQSVDLAIREIQRQARRFMNGSIDPEPLQAAISRTFYSKAAGFESASSIVALLRKQLEMGAPPSELHDSVDRVSTITAEQVQQTLRTWFDPDKAKIVIVGDYRQLKASLSRLDMGPIEIRNLEGEVLRTEERGKGVN
jgi:predicted Zn-dependent peptidase